MSEHTPDNVMVLRPPTVIIQTTMDNFSQPDPDQPDLWVVVLTIGFKGRLPTEPVAALIMPPPQQGPVN